MTNAIATAIATAIAPLRDAAIEDANALFDQQVLKAIAKLEAANWDLEVAAPWPAGYLGREEYMRRRNVRGFYSSITIGRASNSNLMNQPVFVDMNEARIERVREQVKAEASASFDAYSAKLQKKVGAVESAELVGDGANLWAYSILRVTLADGTAQNWKTQRILNFSGLGTMFHQWPTRLMK
jgi:hypothetical protein